MKKKFEKEAMFLENEKWEKAIAKEPLENEPLVSVRFVDMETGDLKVAPAQYKDWKTMAKKSFYHAFGDMYIPKSLSPRQQSANDSTKNC